MSIIFFCPDATTHKVTCDYRDDCIATGVPCKKDCDGTKEESDAPECNFSNDNAFGVMTLVGLPKEYHGEIKIESMPKLQQALLMAINKEKARKHLIRKPYITDRFVDCGNTDEWTLKRLHAIQALVTYAQLHKLKIAWE